MNFSCIPRDMVMMLGILNLTSLFIKTLEGLPLGRKSLLLESAVWMFDVIRTKPIRYILTLAFN